MNLTHDPSIPQQCDQAPDLNRGVPTAAPKLTRSQVRELLQLPLDELTEKGNQTALAVHGNGILLRGLIEVTNYCTCDCLYCGIRKSNPHVQRYRLTDAQILSTVREGYHAGLRTFVLQGGEDPAFTAARICKLLEDIRDIIGPGAAVTLSFGSKSKDEYRSFVQAGADRYLLRFETSDARLHAYLRNGIRLADRLRTLEDIRSAGFQVGSGFMVGLPGETEETIVENIILAGELSLDMAGIGPFIPHDDTPLKDSPQVPLERSIRATALLRLMIPECHIPATTAAGSLEPSGREQMIRAGANVLMPNITPVDVKQHYLLYPGKVCLTENGIDIIKDLRNRIQPLGRHLSFERGDALRLNRLLKNKNQVVRQGAR